MNGTVTRVRALLPKISGVILMVLGLLFIYQGARTLGGPALPPHRAMNTYIMSRQIEDIGAGCMAIIFGIMAYRSKERVG